MLLGCIADDFTGASDVANTIARGGMRTRLFVGAADISDDCDAGVIALKSRSIAPADAIRQSLSALERLLAAGCRQIVFKYCSTFDSTPEGNIGPVAEALARALGVAGVVVCPAFPATGRTVYQGHLFVGDKLLSASGMERHPLTPMTDPDIRRWLQRQSTATVGHIDHATVRLDPAAVRRRLAEEAALDHILVVVDATSEEDLRAIGVALADARLVTGASGVALGLPDNFRDAGLLPAPPLSFGGVGGPALVLSGSCSVATRKQVELYRADHPSIEVDVDRLIAGEPVVAEAVAFVAKHALAAPLVYSTAEPERVAAAQTRHGAETSALAVEALFGEIVRRSVDGGVRRIVVAGGETSGAVVTALDLHGLDIGPEIDPGVPALRAVTPAGFPLGLALKSGNFGAPDFLSRAVAMLGGGGE